MSFNVRVIRKEEMTTSAWSGGTTTQLLIDPPNADYALRQFNWRLSSATVELEESVFTSLPGVHRILMVLQGSMTILHQDHYVKTLSRFESDEFEGDWNTSSKGKVTDFNLMTKDGFKGELFTFELTAGEKKYFSMQNNTEAEQTYFLYCPFDEVTAELAGSQLTISDGDLLVVTGVLHNIELALALSQSKNASSTSMSTVVCGRITQSCGGHKDVQV